MAATIAVSVLVNLLLVTNTALLNCAAICCEGVRGDGAEVEESALPALAPLLRGGDRGLPVVPRPLHLPLLEGGEGLRLFKSFSSS